MNTRKWLEAILSIAVALAAIAIFGFISYKLIGLIGVLGVVIVVAALLINSFLIKKEDDLPGGFNNPIQPPRSKTATPPDPDDA